MTKRKVHASQTIKLTPKVIQSEKIPITEENREVLQIIL